MRPKKMRHCIRTKVPERELEVRMKNKKHTSVVRLTSLALLAALVVVLQTIATGIKIGPVPISLTLVPIVVGAILFGPGAGAFLGGVFVYKALSKNQTLGCIAAAICAPIVNTGVFAVGMLTVFRSILQDFAGGTDIVYYFFVAFIGVNFLVELGVNAVLSAAIARIVKAVQKAHGEANS